MSFTNLECILTDVDNINIFTLNILDIKDTIGSIVIKHQILNRDGALTQVVGEKPHTVSFKTFWFGSRESISGVNGTYSDHFAFLDYVNPFVSGVTFYILQHPKYGNILGRVENVSVVADDRQSYAEIDLVFIEDKISVQNGAQAASFTNPQSITQYTGALQADYATSTGLQLQTLGYGDLAGKLFDPTKPIASQLSGYSRSIRAFGSDIDNNLAALNTLVQSFTSPLTSVNTAITTLTDIPTILYNQFINATNVIVQVFSSASQLFDIKSIANNFGLLNNIFTGNNAPFFQSAWTQASAPSLIQCQYSNVSQDITNRNILENSINQPAFDVLGNLINTINTSTNILSLQNTQIDTQIVRSYTELSISFNPSGYSTKLLLSQLQNYIMSIQLQLIKTYQLTVSMQPLATLLMTLGKNYHEADEMLALNPQILNPNFVFGQVTVYA
jgi:hypothetical protein